MKLRYHLGKNFGDALNPMVFEKFLPGYFDDNGEKLFVGIGSILGFKMENAKRKLFLVLALHTEPCQRLMKALTSFACVDL